MDKVVDIVDKMEEEKKRAIILAFISAILFVVPFVGEVVGTISTMASIGRVIALMGELGNATMDVYTIVTDKENASLAIFGLITAPLALTNVAAIGRVANGRRALADADVAKLGKNVGARMDVVKKVTGSCVRRK